MALRKIVTIDDEKLLRRKSKEVKFFDNNLHLFLDDMKETMEAADGAGLAAPQLGILKRVIICMIDEKAMEFINPVIEKVSGEVIESEGCLSVPKKMGSVARPAEITVTAQNRNGIYFTYTGKDFNARVLCHEIDHLDGILYIDKATKIVSL